MALYVLSASSPSVAAAYSNLAFFMKVMRSWRFILLSSTTRILGTRLIGRVAGLRTSLVPLSDTGVDCLSLAG